MSQSCTADGLRTQWFSAKLQYGERRQVERAWSGRIRPFDRSRRVDAAAILER